MTFKTPIAPTLFAGLVLALASAPAAQALDGYWHGILSNDWNDGLAGDASNWFDMAPPNGDAVAVPDVTAIFAPGAMTQDVVVKKLTKIKKIEFAAGNDAYTIFVTSQGALTITGAGVSNVSAVDQKFHVDGNGALLTFRNKAEAGIPGAGAKPISILNKDKGKTRFKGNSSASDANITNKGGTLEFRDNSSAGSAHLKNNNSKSEISFLDKSTGDKAKIDNKKGAVSFDKSKRGSVPVGKINNESRLIIGQTKVVIDKSLALAKSSRVKMKAGKKNQGKIVVGAKAALGGILTVKGSTKINAGRYTLITARKGRTGRFKKTRLNGFGNKLKPSIVYQGRRVILVVKNK